MAMGEEHWFQCCFSAIDSIVLGQILTLSIASSISFATSSCFHDLQREVLAGTGRKERDWIITDSAPAAR